MNKISMLTPSGLPGFSLALFLVPLASGVFAQGRNIEAPENSREDIGLRDRFAKHFVMHDGTTRAFISAGSIHYLDGNGAWQDIDEQITASTRAGYVAGNTANTLMSHYPATAAAGSGVEVSSEAGIINVAIHPRLEALAADGSVLTVLEKGNAAQAQWSGNKVAYHGVFSSASNEFVTGPDMLKNNLVLSNLPAGLPSNAMFLAYTETIRVPQGWTLTTGRFLPATEGITNTALFIKDVTGEAAFMVPVPEVFELNNPSESIHPDGNWPHTYKVKDAGNGNYEVSTLVPVSWLTNQGRNFPVVIDPTVTLTGNYGGWQNTGLSYLDGNPTTFVFTGLNTNSNNYNSYTKFNTSSIPNGSLILDSDIKVELNGSGNAATTETILVNDVTGTVGPYGSYQSAVFTDLGNGNYTSFSCTALGTYGFYDMGTTADADVQASLSLDYFQVGFSIASATTWKRFTSNLNFLQVEYVSCTGSLSASASSTTNSFGYHLDCFGDSTGSISASATGGSAYVFVWSGPNGYQDSVQNPTGLKAGTYFLTVYSGSICPDTLSITLTEPEELVINGTLDTYIGGRHISCNGETDGGIGISVTGSTGYTYSWTGPGSFTSTSQNLTGLGAGMYYLTVTEGNNSCTVTDSFELLEPFELYTSIINAEDAYCANDTNGSAEVSVVGGSTPYSYMWSGGQTSGIVTGLSANTNHSVTTTDPNNCTSVASVFIGAEHELPQINLGPPDTGYCEGGNVLLNAGAGFMSYLWSDNSTGQLLAVSALGIYSVTVTSFAGCSNSDQISVSEVYALPSPNLGPNVSTGTIPAMLNAGNYEAYFWSTGDTSQTILVYVAGNYTVTVTDFHGCKGNDEVKVSFWPAGVEGPGDEPGLVLYPVPARDFITVTSPYVSDPVLKMTMVNTLGQAVMEINVPGSAPVNERLSLGHLPRGLYFMQVSGETLQWQKPFIID